jgi:uncharacterized membrane protein YphA (DoxX/SURF4 family)
LRLLLGLQLIVQSVAYVQTASRGLLIWTTAVFTFACGALLLFGLMTPLIAALTALGGVGLLISLLPLPNQDFFNGNLALIDLIILSLAVAALGPGAFSVDARMFGRREITIPSSLPLKKQ